jgi:TusA-related sulfurtransferase
MIDHAKNAGNYKEGDKLKIVVDNPNLNHPISKYMNSDDNTIVFMNQIENIITSNENIDITQCTFNVLISGIPRGSKSSKIINLANDVRTKRCITQIKNNDNLCCPRAIVTALTYHTNKIFGVERNVKHIREGHSLHTKLVEELCNKLGRYNEDGFTLEDIKHVEELLDIQIKVVCAEKFNSIIYSGEERETNIYLYKQRNHFDIINSMKSFLGSIYYCDKPYNNKNKHKCTTARTDVVNSAQNPRILRKKKIRYIVKTVTDTVLIKNASTTTQMFAKKFINAELVVRLNKDQKSICVVIHFVAIIIKLSRLISMNAIYILKMLKITQKNISGLIMRQHKIPVFTYLI